MTDLANKVVLVSGAARGIGAQIARAVVAAGGSVVIGDILPEGEELAAELGERARFFRLDVTSYDQWQEAVQFTVATFGSLNGLVNNAGIAGQTLPIGDVSVEHFKRVLDIDLTGVFLGMKAAILQLRAQGNGGSIVNISSAGGLVGLPTTHAYGAAKWGVRGMTKIAAVEEGQHSIRVNSVHPGMVTTAMTSGAIAPGQGNFPGAPLEQRMGEPQEIAAVVAFLLSDDSSYMSGAELAVDGAWTAGP